MYSQKIPPLKISYINNNIKIFINKYLTFVQKNSTISIEKNKRRCIIIKLDYTIESPEERLKLVNQIIAETPHLTSQYLESLADYLILCMEKQDKKQKKILTDNRMVTVNMRETSFEGLVGQLENGEDGIYNLMVDSDKNVLFKPKIKITNQDKEDIPLLKQLCETIEKWDKVRKRTTGRNAFVIKRALIEMRKDQYLIKQAYKPPVRTNKLSHSTTKYIPMEDKSTMSAAGEITIAGISFMDPIAVSAILCNYSRLKEDSWDKFDGDLWYLIQSFEEVCDAALKHYPLYQKILEYKIDGLQNTEIQERIYTEFNIKYSLQYISSLWRTKIPRLISNQAKFEFITFEYKRRHLPFKKCTKCGQEKPMHNFFFSKNNASKDHFYSICKECRNKKKGD